LAELAGSATPYDAKAYTGIGFWARGSATRFRVMLVDRYSDPAGGVCTGCNDHFQHAFTPSEVWQKYTFSWKELTQLSFGDSQPNVCPSLLSAVQFQWSANDMFELCLDDVAFTTALGTPEDPLTPGVTPVTAQGSGCGCRSAGRGALPWGLVTLLGLVIALRRLAVRRRVF
jgi:MYXO-CTERM domain-containing protein